MIWRHPANRGRRVRALVRAVGWQTFKRCGGSHWDVEAFGASRVRCYAGSYSAGRVIYYGGRPDWDEMGFVAHYLRPGDAVIDVGANMGAYTLLAAGLVGEAGRVEAFEAGTLSLQRLRENVSLNAFEKRVRIHAAAASDAPGVVRFTQDHDTTNRIASGGAADGSIETQAGAIDVPAVRLDDALAGGRFAFAKVDVEGAEFRVLQGAPRLLAERNPPVWLIELSEAVRSYGGTEEQVEQWLAERGYRFHLYDADRRELRRGERLWQQSGNLLAIADEHVKSVLERCGARALFA